MKKIDGEVAGVVPVDISMEAYRFYTYSDGRKFTINAPVELFVLRADSHRVVDADGITHRPESGWIGISWMPRSGAPAFVK